MTELWRYVLNFCFWHGKLVAPKVWCWVLQSEFCDGLRITSRKPLKLRYNFISRCSKADYPCDRRSGNTKLKSYHSSGNGQGDIWQIGLQGATYYVAWFYGFRKKSEPTFTQWSGNRKYGKSWYTKPFTKAMWNKKVRIAEQWRNGNCSTANLRTRQTGRYSVTKPLVHSGRKCKVQYTKLSSAVSEILWTKKYCAAGKDSAEFIDENYVIHDVWEFRR